MNSFLPVGLPTASFINNYNSTFWLTLAAIPPFLVMMFWAPALQIAAKMDRLKQAETKLLEYAREFGDLAQYTYRISTLDTEIPRNVIPLKNNSNENNNSLTIHSVLVQSNKTDENQKKIMTKTPLVLMHGYGNAAAYFYRNLAGITHFFQTIYSLDMLGWGLSSRPPFQLLEGKDEISATEAFFVESLEAWRKQNKIDKMVLAGHSMGGYASVAYCEKYPQHVEHLILLSPVGVPAEDPDVVERRAAMRRSSWKMWALGGVAQHVFHYHSVGGVFRSMPSSWGQNMVFKYVERRLPAICDPQEQLAVAEYLVANNALPGSGEHCLNKLLNEYAMAKRPCEHRIPYLKVPSVTFLYGEHDWMDPRGGLSCQQKAEARPDQQSTPDIRVYQIRNAGHLLMLENWQEVNAALIVGAGGSLDCLPPHQQRMHLRQLVADAMEPQHNNEIMPSSKVTSFQRESFQKKQQTSTVSLSESSAEGPPQITS